MRLAFVDATRPPSPAFVNHCLTRVAALGYRRVLTSALDIEAEPVLAACGFTVEDELVVLTRRIGAHEPAACPPPGFRLARCRTRGAGGALAVDSVAFPPDWRLDRAGLREALRATPRSRMVVVYGRAGPAGYAITGTGRQGGFVQRLAVAPQARRAGLGTALVTDGLAWMKRRRVPQATVNTQATNEVALNLYRRLGFAPCARRMVVMSVPIRN